MSRSAGRLSERRPASRAFAASVAQGAVAARDDARQIRDGSGLGPVHDRRSMLLNCSLADAKVRCDVLAGLARENQLHDLTLPGRQTDRVPEGCVSVREKPVFMARMPQSFPHARDEPVRDHGLFDEIRRSLLNGLHGLGDPAGPAQDHDRRPLRHVGNAAEKFQAVHAWKVHVENQAGGRSWMVEA